MIHPLAAKPPPKDLLIDADHLRREYYTRTLDFATARNESASPPDSPPVTVNRSSAASAVAGARLGDSYPVVDHGRVALLDGASALPLRRLDRAVPAVDDLGTRLCTAILQEPACE
jgi:hypothetical protein